MQIYRMARATTDTTDMYNLYDNNDEQPHHDHETDHIPTNTDPNRPPQLNLGNTGCHCNCGCLCSSSNDDGDGSGIQSEAMQHIINGICNDNNDTHYASSEPGDAPVNGQEGDEHMIEAGDLGPIPYRTVTRALARQNRCTCVTRLLPDTYQDTAYNTSIDSDMMSPTDSMLVDPSSSSSDPSMASSQVLSIPSCSSSVVFGAGEMFMHDAILERLPALYQPLRLTPDVPFDYPMTLSISASELELELGIPRDEDFW